MKTPYQISPPVNPCKYVSIQRSSKSKITKDKSGKSVPHLEITEVVLVHIISDKFAIIVNNDYQKCRSKYRLY